MTFLVSLPCVVKKDFKQALNISVSDLEKKEKPNNTLFCPSFSTTESIKNLVSSQKKSLQKFDDYFTEISYLSEISYFHFHPFADFDFTAAVPIYVLYEQYLI